MATDRLERPAKPAPSGSTRGAGTPRVSVVLPTYNEVGNIADLVDAISEALRGSAFEVVVVDDDSPDGTWRVVQEKSARAPWLRVERRVGARGLTTAIARGIELARGEVVCWMDCDFSMPPSLLPKLVDRLDDGFDMAVGSRYVPGGKDARLDTRMRIAASRVITTLARWLLVRGFHDYTSGFVAARRALLEAVPLRGDYGEYFIDLVVRAHRLGYRLVEIPYACVPRRSGESKTDGSALDFFRKGLKYLFVVARLLGERVRRPSARKPP